MVTGLVDGFDGYEGWKDEDDHVLKIPCMWEDKK